ncbi:hypothetical protein [Enhygromyxa salina]|nr:hypothetical protein [Enhygromyxa salina]
MRSSVLRPLSRRPALLLGLLGCQGPVDPGPTQPPAQPIVAAPEAEPTPERLTWDELRGTLPAAQAYAPTTHAQPPAWLEQVDTLWLRVGDECRPISLEDRQTGAPASDAKPQRAASLEQCHEVVHNADVRCSTELEVGATFTETGVQECVARMPSGAGSTSGSISGFDDGASTWSLIAFNETQLRYAKTWSLWVEAEQLTWVQSECTAASLAALTDALNAEAISEQARLEALHQRFGVVGHSRRCMVHDGTRLHALPSWTVDRSDRGAGRRSELAPQDCTIPCPDTAAPLRQINAVLTKQPFVRVDDSAAIVLHRARASCESNPDGGLPPPANNPCREH